jgi:AcrR family transcriptional regulator
VTARSTATRASKGLQAASDSNPGKREAKKLDKLRRIKAAALDLFLQRGYDETTVRMIADQASVGLGTMFSYARDKRDLLFLILNEGFEEAVAYAEATMRGPRLSLQQRLQRIFRHHYLTFSGQPHLYRYALRELQFYAATDQAAIFQATRERLFRIIVSAVKDARTHSEVDPTIDVELAASVLFSVFQAEVRHWISQEQRRIDEGMTHLERALDIVLTGLRPKDVGALPSSRTSRTR